MLTKFKYFRSLGIVAILLASAPALAYEKPDGNVSGVDPAAPFSSPSSLGTGKSLYEIFEKQIQSLEAEMAEAGDAPNWPSAQDATAAFAAAQAELAAAAANSSSGVGSGSSAKDVSGGSVGEQAAAQESASTTSASATGQAAGPSAESVLSYMAGSNVAQSTKTFTTALGGGETLSFGEMGAGYGSPAQKQAEKARTGRDEGKTKDGKDRNDNRDALDIGDSRTKFGDSDESLSGISKQKPDEAKKDDAKKDDDKKKQDEKEKEKAEKDLADTKKEFADIAKSDPITFKHYETMFNRIANNKTQVQQAMDEDKGLKDVVTKVFKNQSPNDLEKARRNRFGEFVDELDPNSDFNAQRSLLTPADPQRHNAVPADDTSSDSLTH